MRNLSALFFLFCFNPYTGRVIASVLLHPEVYWRVFWIVPIPLFLAVILILMWPLHIKAEERVSHRVKVALLLLQLALFGLVVPTRTTLARSNRTKWKAPALKADRGYSAAALLNKQVPAGSFVLAPARVAPWIPTFHHHVYPLVSRGQYLKPLESKLGIEDLMLRNNLVKYVSGHESGRR